MTTEEALKEYTASLERVLSLTIRELQKSRKGLQFLREELEKGQAEAEKYRGD